MLSHPATPWEPVPNGPERIIAVFEKWPEDFCDSSTQVVNDKGRYRQDRPIANSQVPDFCSASSWSETSKGVPANSFSPRLWGGRVRDFPDARFWITSGLPTNREWSDFPLHFGFRRELVAP
jgi:hypothetical protein